MFLVKSSYDLFDGGRQHLVPVKMIWNPIARGVFCVGGVVGKDFDYGST